MAINGFQRGSGCFKCIDCGRQTRNTGEQAVGSELCPECWEAAGLYNEFQDGHITEAEMEQQLVPIRAAVIAKGGNPTY